MHFERIERGNRRPACRCGHLILYRFHTFLGQPHGVREVLVVRELFRWRCAVHADKTRNCAANSTAVIYVLHYPHLLRRYAPEDPFP
ncbi:hypothetical protein SAMN04490220_3285 [Rhodococcus jostii]|uniref:Transposase n=1 Tax=Rhodococcus jostii TaxID=132919 RepID=A0A1H4XDQ6_RHOJO|nr:hypothetical protein SAMN04490220_3285 [Rhodococcus jostii]